MGHYDSCRDVNDISKINRYSNSTFEINTKIGIEELQYEIDKLKKENEELQNQLNNFKEFFKKEMNMTDNIIVQDINSVHKIEKHGAILFKNQTIKGIKQIKYKIEDNVVKKSFSLEEVNGDISDFIDNSLLHECIRDLLNAGFKCESALYIE